MARVQFLTGTVFYYTVSTPDFGPIQPPIQGVREVLSLWVKRPVREADLHFLQSAILTWRTYKLSRRERLVTLCPEMVHGTTAASRAQELRAGKRHPDTNHGLKRNVEHTYLHKSLDKFQGCTSVPSKKKAANTTNRNIL
jgi:hypothetical protein